LYSGYVLHSSYGRYFRCICISIPSQGIGTIACRKWGKINNSHFTSLQSPLLHLILMVFFPVLLITIIFIWCNPECSLDGMRFDYFPGLFVLWLMSWGRSNTWLWAHIKFRRGMSFIGVFYMQICYGHSLGLCGMLFKNRKSPYIFYSCHFKFYQLTTWIAICQDIWPIKKEFGLALLN